MLWLKEFENWDVSLNVALFLKFGIKNILTQSARPQLFYYNAVVQLQGSYRTSDWDLKKRVVPCFVGEVGIATLKEFNIKGTFCYSLNLRKKERKVLVRTFSKWSFVLTWKNRLAQKNWYPKQKQKSNFYISNDFFQQISEL